MKYRSRIYYSAEQKNLKFPKEQNLIGPVYLDRRK